MNKSQQHLQEQEIEKGYLECERCKTTNGIFDCHHIIFKSEAPKHKNIDHPDNFIVLCRNCHNFFHGKGKDGNGVEPTTKKEDRLYLVEERGLNKLFNS